MSTSQEADAHALISGPIFQVRGLTKTYRMGEVAILSAASTMTNQNAWIEAMKEEWKKPSYNFV